MRNPISEETSSASHSAFDFSHMTVQISPKELYNSYYNYTNNGCPRIIMRT